MIESVDYNAIEHCQDKYGNLNIVVPPGYLQIEKGVQERAILTGISFIADDRNIDGLKNALGENTYLLLMNSHRLLRKEDGTWIGPDKNFFV